MRKITCHFFKKLHENNIMAKTTKFNIKLGNQSNLLDKYKKKIRGKPFVKNDPRIKGNGRPKGQVLASTYLRMHVQDSDIAKVIVDKALEGDKDMLILCAAYLWGKPVNTIINENNGNDSIKEGIKIMFVDANKKEIENAQLIECEDEKMDTE